MLWNRIKQNPGRWIVSTAAMLVVDVVVIYILRINDVPIEIAAIIVGPVSVVVLAGSYWVLYDEYAQL